MYNAFPLFPSHPIYLKDLNVANSDSSNRDAASLGEEEIVLVQVIKSIMSIIKQDPPSHERVRFSISSLVYVSAHLSSYFFITYCSY